MSIFKTLIKVSTKEWACYVNGEIYTSNTPTILAKSANIELLKDYHRVFAAQQEPIEWDDYEIIEVEIKEI